MRRLILTRHAKSSWDTPGLPDHDRPLSPRGRRSAELLAEWIAQSKFRPDAILCSTSARTRATLAPMLAAISPAPDPVYDRGLYHAATSEIFRIVQDSSARCLMVVGHNPGIGSLARMLASREPDHPKFRRYTTGATAVMDFGIGEWRDIQPSSGETIAFVTPDDLGSVS